MTYLKLQMHCSPTLFLQNIHINIKPVKCLLQISQFTSQCDTSEIEII